MTTVAFDGITMAADTRCTSNGLPCRVTKAWRLADGRLFGACGSMSTAAAVKEWLDGGAEKPPPAKDFTGLLVISGQAVEVWVMDENMELWKVEAPAKFAIGSGRDFALAAMALGKTAREAVELAAQFDVWTGLPVVEFELVSQ